MSVSGHIDLDRHPIGDADYAARCRRRLDHDGALVLPGFVRRAAVDAVVRASAGRVGDAFYADGTHNVYLTDSDPSLDADHPFNRQVVSSKGLIADDELPDDSPMRELYGDSAVRRFLCGVLGIDAIHPYADALSSINVHFAPSGRELGWHFDNSSFAVTMLLQAPDAGGAFEYVPDVRGEGPPDDAEYERVRGALDGETPLERLDFAPGDLLVFRGRQALHRVTPTEGDTIRMLVVFAYNDQPGVSLSDSALQTFYGRTS